MKDKIKAILKEHVKKTGAKIVKVTTTKYYEIPASPFKTPTELMDEWFKKFSISRSHAFRDASLLIEHFNEDCQIINVNEE